MPGESVNIAKEINGVCWLHQGSKGYVILPVKKLLLQIKSGTEVNITDRKIANKKPNFIIAVSHGAEPGKAWDNAYRYVQLPNVKRVARTSGRTAERAGVRHTRRYSTCRTL